MEKLRSIFGMNEETDKLEPGTYEEALSMARKALNDMG